MPAAIALTGTLAEDARHVRTRAGGSRLALTLAIPLPQRAGTATHTAAPIAAEATAC